MDDMIGAPRKDDEPFDRLTHLCAAMTDALGKAIDAEDPPSKDGTIRSIVFLEDDKAAGIETQGYEGVEAVAAILTHIKAILQTYGKDLEIVAIPESPEGLMN